MLRQPTRRRALAAGLASCLVAASAVLLASVPAAGAHGRDHVAPRATAAAAAPTATQLAAQLEKAVAAHTYPEAVARVLGDPTGSNKVPYVTRDFQCLDPHDIFNTTECNFESPAAHPKLAVVLGDSVAASILPGVKDAIGDQYDIHGLALPGCPVAAVQVYLSFNVPGSDRCNRSHLLLYAQVQRLHPDLLILTDSASGLQRLASKKRGEDAVQEWIRGERIALNLLQAPGRRVVVLAPNPVASDPRICAIGNPDPRHCLYRVDPWWYGKRRAESMVAAETGSVYVDTLPWFAVKGVVPMFAGTTTMQWDASHLSNAYSRKLAGVLRPALLGHP